MCTNDFIRLALYVLWRFASLLLQYWKGFECISRLAYIWATLRNHITIFQHAVFKVNIMHTGLCLGVCVCVCLHKCARVCVCNRVCVCVGVRMLIRWRLFAVPPYIIAARCELWVTDNSPSEKTVTSRICTSNPSAGNCFSSQPIRHWFRSQGAVLIPCLLPAKVKMMRKTRKN